MPRLETTQEALWRLISAPEGVASGIAALGAADRERLLPGGLDALVRGDERLSAEARLDVYANMYFFRLLDCLKEDFPAVARVLGKDGFHDLVTEYLVEHPSEHPSVRFLGRHLAEFLERHAASRARPDLPGLARFEWALVEAFDAPDAEPLPAERLREIAPEAWGELRLRFTPSLRRVEALGRVDEVWKAATEGGETPGPGGEPARFRVWREALRVYHRPLDAAEAAMLDAMVEGASFGEVCERLAESIGEEETAAAAAPVLARWFADGMVVELAS